jgi:tetratricopeptide (TPR) repeat protein
MTPDTTPETVADDGASAAFPAGTPLSPETVPGASAETAFAVWQVLRSATLWAGEPPEHRDGMFARAEMDAWERRLLTSSLEPEVRFPLAVIVAEMAAGAAAGARLSWACVCVADWALGRGARRLALAFAEAAARADPEHPRYAWLVGRLMRSHGDPKTAERWLRRALRLSTDQRDWETQSRTLTALGNLCVETGRYPDARDWHTRALRVSRRWRLREQEGMALHDLFVMATEDGAPDEAERYAGEALAAYRSVSPARVVKLAHDVAYWWMDLGQYCEALDVFLALRDHFERSDEAFRVVCNIGRAAGGCGDRRAFDAAYAEAEELLPTLVTSGVEATALLEMAYGAVALGDWSRAASLAKRAEKAARTQSEATVLTRAAQLLETVDLPHPDVVAVTARRNTGPADRLASALVASLPKREAKAAAVS